MDDDDDSGSDGDSNGSDEDMDTTAGSLSKCEAVLELLSLAVALGGHKRRNRKKLREMCSITVSEVYSPPRVAAAASKLRHLDIDPGLSLDLTTCDDEGNPWDFTIKSMRNKA